MKKSKVEKINDILAVIAAAAMIAVIVMIAVSHGLGTETSFTELRRVKSWTYGDGTPVNEEKTVIGYGDRLTISGTLPDNIRKNENVYIWNRKLSIDASIDGRYVYRSNGENGDLTKYDDCDTWQKIQLSPADSGRTLTLDIVGLSYRQIIDTSQIYIGTINDVSLKSMNINIPVATEGFAIILIAVILLVYWFVLKHYGIDDYRKAMLDLSIMAFLVIVWFVMESPLVMVVFSHGAFRYITALFAAFLCIIPCIKFYSDVFDSYARHLRIEQFVYTATIITSVVLMVANVITTQQAMIVFVFAVPVVLIYIAYCCIREDMIKHDKLNGYMFLSIMLLLVGSTLNTYSYFFSTSLDTDRMFRRFYLLTLICIGFSLVKRSMRRFADVRAIAQYKELAYVDKVTGGETKLRFAEHLKTINGRNGSAWFINIDLVNFKLVNQAYGWDNGNRLLMNMYFEINSMMDTDEHVCNLGNASFGCLLFSSDVQDLKRKIGIISQKMNKCARSIDRNLLVKTAFYVCMIEEGEDDIDDLLDHTIMANKNRYAEYIEDINCYIYNDKCRQELLFDKELENMLGEAITGGELLVYYQPKIDLTSGVMRGAEALVRWNNSKYGMLMPGRFIPLFEQNGMIVDADLYVLRCVCDNINHWLSVGITPPKVSVNISKAAINRDDVMNRYGDIMSETGVPRKYLEFELTESMAYNDYDKIQKLIDRIHSDGSTCSMDDFGKSYSNLNALDTLNFDTVKMDKCFFDNGFPHEIKKYKMVEGTLALLKHLDLEVVAEGIEYSDQVAELKRLGCDEIQGFYYAKPMPVKDFEMFMRASTNLASLNDTVNDRHHMI